MSPRSSASSSSQQQNPQEQHSQPPSQQTPQFVNPNPNGGQRKAAGRVYVPRIYGFKVSERAKSGPRMQWLRVRPQDPEELDLVDWRGQWYEDADDEYDDEEEEDRPMEDFDPVSFILRLPCYSLTDLAYIRIIRKVTTMTTTRRKRKKKNTGATVDQQTVREALRVARHLLRCLHLPVHPLAHHQRCSAWRRLEAYPTSQ